MADDFDARLARLRKRLGKLWSDDDIVVIDGTVSDEKLYECRRTLFGQLHTNPSVDFRAFRNAMRKVWRNDNVSFALVEHGIFAFTFESEAEKDRVLDGGPWSFADHLLLLEPCEPDTPPQCYVFTSCALWVQIHGLPREWILGTVRRVASEIGTVLEVRVEAKGQPPSYIVGRVRIRMNVADPLKSGIVISRGERKLRLDFKYEKLPGFCCSCGRMGHYAKHCEEVPFEAARLDAEREGRFGQWLRAEVDEFSPSWKIFYNEGFQEEGAEERDPRNAGQ